MTITTPEQMREAAAKEVLRIGLEIGVTGVPVVMLAAVNAIRAIRATAQQPVAVTVKPLVWDGHVAHTTFGSYAVHDCRGYGQTYRLRLPMGVEGHTVLSHCSELMFTTQELAKAAAQADYEARILSALTIHPADPLSDPRVGALVEAAAVLIMQHDMENPMRQADFHGDMCQCRRCRMDVLRAALRAIGGEA